MRPTDERRRINYEHELARMRPPLSHGRTRRRWAQRAALILYVVAGLIFFVAWSVMLAMLILILTD
jgi:hypothetical protein